MEIVRRIFQAVESRDTATILGLYDPSVEVHTAPGSFAENIGGRTWSGHDGLRAFDQELRDAFDSVKTSCEELVDAGGCVVSHSKYRVRGRGSGIELDSPEQFGVWTVREGRVIAVGWYPKRTEALEAAGLAG